MPLFVDIHQVLGATAVDVARAHEADLGKQHEHGVECIKYWFNESCGKIFCLIEAPNIEAADAVHRESHGLTAEKIIEVDPDLADGFLGGGAVNAQGAGLVPGGTDRDTAIRTVMFTDIVGSTALTQRLGDEGAMTVLKQHDAIVRRALVDHGGREIKHTGDGIMACFVSAVAAARCAADIQHAVAQADSADFHIQLRIGAAAGEPVEHNQDLFGTTVQLAARLCAHAEPEQILVSSGICELCLGKGLSFDEMGELSLKGFDKPVRAHGVAWRALYA